MKKFLAVVGLMMLAGGAMAASNPALLTLNVTPTGTKLVSLSTGTINVSLGVNTLGNVISTGVVVNNAGNVPTTYQLSLTSPLWGVAAAPGVDIIHMQAEFNTIQPGAGFGATNDLTVAAKTSGTAGGNFAGNQNGVNVAPAANVTLWFNIDMPTALLEAPALQAFTVTVTAS